LAPARFACQGNKWVNIFTIDRLQVTLNAYPRCCNVTLKAMIIVCSNCQKRFRLPDAKIKSTGTTVRCSNCRHTFVVHPPEPSDEQAPISEAIDDALRTTEGGASAGEEAPENRPDDLPLDRQTEEDSRSASGDPFSEDLAESWRQGSDDGAVAPPPRPIGGAFAEQLDFNRLDGTPPDDGEGVVPDRHKELFDFDSIPKQPIRGEPVTQPSSGAPGQMNAIGRIEPKQVNAIPSGSTSGPYEQIGQSQRFAPPSTPRRTVRPPADRGLPQKSGSWIFYLFYLLVAGFAVSMAGRSYIRRGRIDFHRSPPIVHAPSERATGIILESTLESYFLPTRTGGEWFVIAGRARQLADRPGPLKIVGILYDEEGRERIRRFGLGGVEIADDRLRDGIDWEVNKTLAMEPPVLFKNQEVVFKLFFPDISTTVDHFALMVDGL